MSRTSLLRVARLSASRTTGSGADAKDRGLGLSANVPVIRERATAYEGVEGGAVLKVRGFWRRLYQQHVGIRGLQEERSPGDAALIEINQRIADGFWHR